MKCEHCGLIHDTTCPRIRAIEYHNDGTVKRIEFHAPQPITDSALDLLRYIPGGPQIVRYRMPTDEEMAASRSNPVKGGGG